MARKRIQVSVAGRKVALTPEQAARINSRVAEFARLEKSIHSLVGERWIPKYLRRTGLPITWSWAHELTVSELVYFLAQLTDSAELLIKAAGESRYEDLLNGLDDLEAEDKVPRYKRRRVVVVIALLIALSYSCRSIGLYSLSIPELVRKGLDGDDVSVGERQVGRGGDDVALRHAVSVDPSVLSMPTVASYLATLQLEGDKRELSSIFRAAVKGPSKQLQPSWQLRYMERVFREGGTIESYGRDAVFRLVTERLRLYDSRGADPFKGLYTAFDRWKESATT